MNGTSSTVSAVSTVTPSRLLYLDGLRGFAALMVVLFHLWGGAGHPTWPVRLAPFVPQVTVDLLSPIGALGGSRVSLFFVLSGFLL
jgi:peptidoglycan/LPS O-acetylase OafA/YrhL